MEYVTIQTSDKRHHEIIIIWLCFNHYLKISNVIHMIIHNMVKSAHKAALYILALIAIIILPGCEIIGGIFKAGVWVGVIIVIFIVVIISFIVAKFKK